MFGAPCLNLSCAFDTCAADPDGCCVRSYAGWLKSPLSTLHKDRKRCETGLAAALRSWQDCTMNGTITLHLTATSAADTARIATRLGQGLKAGDVILLDGPVGAGKSVFARARIQSRLAELGRWEDVPSPSFTLVQTYELDGITLWHADLYRLSDPQDCIELGLDQAFEDAVCLVEWAERLGPLIPPGALHLQVAQGATPDMRELQFRTTNARWAEPLAVLAASMAEGVGTDD